MSEKEMVIKLPMDQLRFLDRCKSFELKGAELYYYFEKLFAEDHGLSMLWKKTAHEEENHAQQFDLAVRLHGIGMEKVNTDVVKATAYLREMETYLERVMASEPSPEEALCLAIKLEEQWAVLHMSSIVIFEYPKIKQLFDALMKQDNGHISMLRDALLQLKESKS